MKIYLIITTLTLVICQNETKQITGTLPSGLKEIQAIERVEKNDINVEKHFPDSICKCESSKYSSQLEEIPNRDSNAYNLTISLTNGQKVFSKILDTRPKTSRINYCNDLYTVVGFPCGGPCYCRWFVFTDKNRAIEVYGYAQEVKNNPNIIAYTKGEEFEKLIFHNFKNGKELIVVLPENSLWNYGQMDSIIMKNKKLVTIYITGKEEAIKKTVNIKSIL